jgi:hypothetical protein
MAGGLCNLTTRAEPKMARSHEAMSYSALPSSAAPPIRPWCSDVPQWCVAIRATLARPSLRPPLSSRPRLGNTRSFPKPVSKEGFLGASIWSAMRLMRDMPGCCSFVLGPSTYRLPVAVRVDSHTSLSLSRRSGRATILLPHAIAFPQLTLFHALPLSALPMLPSSSPTGLCRVFQPPSTKLREMFVSTVASGETS